jgi:hypothetical protein
VHSTTPLHDPSRNQSGPPGEGSGDLAWAEGMGIPNHLEIEVSR